MSDRWRDNYDSYKLASPDENDPRLCEKCEEPMLYARRIGWYCDTCHPRDPDAAREDHDMWRRIEEEWS